MVIQTHDLCKYYGDESNLVKALEKVNLSVDKGELIGIIGKSGSGKSFFLKSLEKKIQLWFLIYLAQ